MSDRFKFRVWKKYENKMFEGVTYLNPLLFNEEIAPDEAKNYIVMQSTGLKDKNRKLIYEGDVVRYTEYEIEDIEPEWEQAEVVWGNDYDNYYPAFDLKDTDFDGTNAFAYLFNEGWIIEVIGNIYENPGLKGVQK